MKIDRALFAVLLAFVAPLAIAAGSWTQATDPPALQAHYGFAQNGEDMYVISGDGGGAIVSTMRRYNAATNVWTSLANVPVGSEAPAAVFSGGKIYVTDGSGGASNAFRIYDVASNTWSLGPSRPGVTHSYGAAAGAFNGNIYIVGGGAAMAGSSIVSIYNIASNTWSAGPNAPSSYRLGGFVQMGQFLYLVGGQTGNAAVNSAVSMRLDMATNTWSTGPAWTPQRADFALAAAGTKLFAMGGDNNGSGDGTSAQVNELETSTWPSGSWFASPDNLPSVRRGNQAGFFSTGRTGGEVWSTSGYKPDGANLDFRNEHLFRAVLPCPDYTVTESTRPLVAATTDTGTSCDACETFITFPFPVGFYDSTYSGAWVSENGNLQFSLASLVQTNTNLPATDFSATLFPFWDNLRTDGAGEGIFTSVSGTAPNRVFTIEWRARNVSGTATANFEIRFFERSPVFEFVYGASSGSFSGTIGVQRNATTSTQFAGPNAQPPAEGTRLLFTTGCCTPIAFNGAIGSGSDTYPGTSGSQTGRVFRNAIQSECGTAKEYPGTEGSTQRTYDQYSFTNSGPATCVTFGINSSCPFFDSIFAVAYLGSFNPSNIATNYLGDSGNNQVIGYTEFSVNIPANSTVVLVVHELVAGNPCASYDVVVTGLCPVELSSAVSRKFHGNVGSFDIALPLVGQPGVECRSSSTSHQIVTKFNNVVTTGTASVTSGSGTAGAPTFFGTIMTIPLSGVTDLQKLVLTLSGVTNTLGQVMPPVSIPINVLLGDTGGNRSVNTSDIGQTKGNSGQSVNAATFRTDTNLSGGTINASDISQVKANSGHMLPP